MELNQVVQVKLEGQPSNLRRVGGEFSDLVEFLRRTPFLTLPYEKKCDLINRRPTPHIDLVHFENKQKRKFQTYWYHKFKWLTASSTTNKLYCFICLLFGGDTEWSNEGISNIKNFDRKARKHQISTKHLQNKECFHLVGKGQIEQVVPEANRLSATKHNEQVTLNRKVIGRLIQVIAYLGKQELSFCEDGDESATNKGNYMELLNMLAQEEQLIRDHLTCPSVFKGLLEEIPYDLIEVITFALNEKIKIEMQKSSFISVQADETLDVSCRSEMSIIFRYCVGDRIEERFIGFFDVSKDKTAEGLSEVINNVLKQWNVEEKLVGQTYDGALMMADCQGGVQKLVKQLCPYALFVPSYAHQLNLVLLHGSKTIKQVRIFLCDLRAFHSFFSKSSKRLALLTEKSFILPHENTTHWNFHSRAISTILEHFSDLNAVFTEIIDDINSEWDPESFNCAKGLKKCLDDPTFVYLLCLYHKTFVFVDHLFDFLQSKTTYSVSACQNQIKITVESIKKLRNETTVENCICRSQELNPNLTFSEGEKCILKSLTYEILDCQVVQMETRYGDFSQLEFVELVNETKYPLYKHNFPKNKLHQLGTQYPFFNCEQLANELSNIYADHNKHQPPLQLLKYLTHNDLDSVYEEVTKLLRLLLTLPLTTFSSEKSLSTLKRVKTYLRNSMTNNRLSCVSTLAIEKKLLGELSSDFAFKERVIDVFAQKKNYGMELAYLKI